MLDLAAILNGGLAPVIPPTGSKARAKAAKSLQDGVGGGRRRTEWGKSPSAVAGLEWVTEDGQAEVGAIQGGTSLPAYAAVCLPSKASFSSTAWRTFAIDSSLMCSFSREQLIFSSTPYM